MNAADRVTIGLVEEVILLPWGVKMPARIDTGAATSSLDVRDLTVKKKVAEFRKIYEPKPLFISETQTKIGYLVFGDERTFRAEAIRFGLMPDLRGVSFRGRAV